MTEFEMMFRGALYRYLRRNGHDVQRITDYWIDTFEDYDFGFVIEYMDSDKKLKWVDIENMSLKTFIQML